MPSLARHRTNLDSDPANRRDGMTGGVSTPPQGDGGDRPNSSPSGALKRAAIRFARSCADVERDSRTERLVVDGSWKRINNALIERDVKGEATFRSMSPRNYMWLDRSAEYGKVYQYLLVAVDINGSEHAYGPAEASPITPLNTMLYGNYPNPFNPTTTIRFDLKEKTRLALNIYDMRGRLLRRLIRPDRPLPPGQYRYQWDAKNDAGRELPSGHYIYFFVTQNGYRKAKKMTLLK